MLVEGTLEALPEPCAASTKGVYCSILIERLWSLDSLESGAASVRGAAELPGENPRAATASG